MSEKPQPPQNESYSVELVRTPAHEQAAAAIENSQFDVPKIVQAYRELVARKRIGDDKTYSFLRGVVAEIHVAQVLESLGIPATIERVITTPNFVIQPKGYSGILVESNENPCAEIDAFVTIDGVPTVVEVKMSYKHSGAKSHLREPLDPEHIRGRMAPLKELDTLGYLPLRGQNGFGYMYVLPRGYNVGNWTDEFRRKSGMIVEFPYTLTELEQILIGTGVLR